MIRPDSRFCGRPGPWRAGWISLLIWLPSVGLAQSTSDSLGSEEGGFDSDAAFEDSAPAEPEAEFDDEASLIDQILESRGGVHFAGCTEARGVRLNEVCAVGVECSPDVRVRDFIELFNASAQDVDLACFALTARDLTVFVPSGRLAPGGIRGFGELELGFRIAKDDDMVVLYRLGADAEGYPALHEVERVRIDRDHAHAYRMPDGGAWRTFGTSEAETDWPGTFGTSNHAAPELDSRSGD